MASAQEAVTRLEFTFDMAVFQRQEALRMHREKIELPLADTQMVPEGA